MPAAGFHAHRNADVNADVVLPDTRVIANGVNGLVPAERMSAICAPPGVVVVSELLGNSETELYAMMHVGNVLKLGSMKA